MASFKIRLPDNQVKEFSNQPTVLDVAKSIGDRLASDTVGGMINDSKEVVDLRTSLEDGDQVKIITKSSPEGVEVLRHSCAHLMAQAVQELWPEIKVTIGPVIENGFFYDFDSPRNFTPEDLLAVEKKMKEIAKAGAEVVKEVWSKDKAIETFTALGEHFKVEIIKDLGEDEVSVYRQGEWFDLCRGPHVQNLKQLKVFKVMSTAGAYWRGNEKNPQLQRIYGTAFHDKKELKEHLHLLEEAKKRDHRKLGKELGLFTFSSLCPGSPFFTPKGAVIYQSLVAYMRDLYHKYQYHEVITPQIFDVELFHQSGHYQNYKENMYFTQVDEREFSVKPMNCPSHCLIFASDKKSYRDLPWRVADFGRLHRHERSGVMHGITRVRSFCQDDAHVFCRMEDLQTEIKSFMTFLNEVYETLGMSNYKIYLSTRPEKRMGSEEVWDQSEEALRTALEDLNLPYEVNAGDGAFYGPKLDIMFVDALKRPWQLGTLQCDFNMPEAFKLSFTAEDNKDHQPALLHRAILGSLERFLGVYLEHTAGKLPAWMSPVQVSIMNVTDSQKEYCKDLYQELFDNKVRAHLDDRSEKLGYKIREAQLQKVPYMLTIGDREKENDTVSVRFLSGKVIQGMSRQDFVKGILKALKERHLNSEEVFNKEKED